MDLHRSVKDEKGGAAESELWLAGRRGEGSWLPLSKSIEPEPVSVILFHLTFICCLQYRYTRPMTAQSYTLVSVLNGLDLQRFYCIKCLLLLLAANIIR